MTELWLPHPEYPQLEGLYEFSDLGNARSLGRKAKLLKQHPNTNGYLQIICSKDCRRTAVRIHAAVCRIFHGPKPHANWHACHGAQGKLVNTASNLYWAPAKQNLSSDKLRDGTLQSGEKHGHSKLTTEQVLEIRRLAAEGVTSKALAVDFGISQPNASMIIRRKTWRHVS